MYIPSELKQAAEITVVWLHCFLVHLHKTTFVRRPLTDGITFQGRKDFFFVKRHQVFHRHILFEHLVCELDTRNPVDQIPLRDEQFNQHFIDSSSPMNSVSKMKFVK